MPSNKKNIPSNTPTAIKLQSRVDIASVSSLRDEWLSGSNFSGEICIDGSAVESFSAAAAQLIVSFSAMLQASGGALKMINLSPSLKKDFAILGLSQFLDAEKDNSENSAENNNGVSKNG